MTAPDQSPSPATSGEGLFAVLERSRSLGFLGPGPVSRHVAHAEAMGAAAGRPDGPVLDLGAGGGVPGLVLALAWPGTSWTLLDASERRAGFLEDAVLRLGLADRVSVLRARAEDAPRGLVERESVELVLARGFGSPAVTAECAAPLVALGGRLVVSEPPDGTPEARWPAEPLAAIGFVAEAVQAGGFSFVVLAKTSPCPASLPRRTGLAAKRPLF